MKYLWKISLILALLTLLFVGCGGSNSKNTPTDEPLDDTVPTPISTEGEETNTTIVLPRCLENNSSNGYLIQKEGNISKIEDNTTIEIWHFDNADKVVCVSRGKAIFTPTP